MRTWITRQMPWLLVVAVMMAALALHAHTAAAAESPEAALRTAIEARGERFGGDCAQTVSPGDIGKVCFRMVEERGAMRAYLVGRTFSEFNSWVFLAQSHSDWLVMAQTPLDFENDSPEIPWP